MIVSNARGFPHAVSNSRSLITCATKIYHSYQTGIFYQIEWLSGKSYFILLCSQIAGFWPKVLDSIWKLKLASISTCRVLRIRLTWPPAKYQHVISMCVFLGHNNDSREKPLKKCFHFLCFIFGWPHGKCQLVIRQDLLLWQMGKTLSCYICVFWLPTTTIQNSVCWHDKHHFHACCIERDKIAELQMNL